MTDIKTIEQINSLDELIQYYESTPQERWCMHSFTGFNGDDITYCALGWLGFTEPLLINNEIFTKLHERFSQKFLTQANDGNIYFGRGKNPKDRVLAYLEDLKLGYDFETA